MDGSDPHFEAESIATHNTSWDLEKDDVQADPTVESGKADMDGASLSEEYPICCTGVVAAACTQGKRTQHGKPRRVIRDDQPDAREGQAGRTWVAERPVVPLKPGNAGGGKGP